MVLAGQEYGTGSSRDWAAKGTALLGVKAVVAQSFERIHRSNLVGMGVLPLQFKEGTNAQSLKLDGTETFDVLGLGPGLKAQQDLSLSFTRANGQVETVPVAFARRAGITKEMLMGGGKPVEVTMFTGRKDPHVGFARLIKFSDGRTLQLRVDR